MHQSIGIVIPTFQGASHLTRCLSPLLQSPLKPRILIIDSSSTDETVSLSRSMGVETLVIPKSEFNHGTTRELGQKAIENFNCRDDYTRCLFHFSSYARGFGQTDH